MIRPIEKFFINSKKTEFFIISTFNLRFLRLFKAIEITYLLNYKFIKLIYFDVIYSTLY